ncbi:MAG: S49 family peptidase, partial [Bacteroidales bacterium]|nr:S49 family peptidase [Bacteroidales bacterium]
DIYENFVTIVAEGRNMDKAKVDELGQGRVWTGAQAIEIGLADEIGGLTDALLFAAEAAGDSNIESWGIQSYPRPMTKMEAFASMLEHATNDNVLAGTPYETIAKLALKWNSETQRNHAFARMTEDYFFVK